jgi:hypothetical protein
MELTPKGLADLVVDTIKGAVDGPMVAERFETLEQRIEELEARPLTKWAGVHVSGLQYAEASLVTHSGSLWVAMEPTDRTPGTEASGWRLIVKRGHA